MTYEYDFSDGKGGGAVNKDEPKEFMLTDETAFFLKEHCVRNSKEIENLKRDVRWDKWSNVIFIAVFIIFQLKS
jgi:hypothetical protein